MKDNPLGQHILERLKRIERMTVDFQTLFAEEQRRIGQSMRHYRTASRVSGRAVAREMELSAMFVNDLEHGNRLWHIDTCKKFLEAVDKLRTARSRDEGKS